MIKLVIIDFDDTLCMSEAACFFVENEIAKTMGLPEMSRELHQKTWGRTFADAIPERFPGIDFAKFMQNYEVMMPKFFKNGQYDNIPEKNYQVLAELTDKDKILTILTSRTKAELNHLLDPIHPLNKWIKEFQYVGSTPYIKPDPHVFDHFLAKYKVAPNEAVYIGDSISDAVGAKAAGLWFIASLESGLRSEADFADTKVDFFIKDFSEVVEVVKQIDAVVGEKSAYYNTASTDKQDELLCEVDENDNLIGSVTRRECHNATRRPWHRSVHIYLFDKTGRLYFSRRSNKKDTGLGLWTVSAGGHVKFGSDYEQTAEVELGEELNLNVPVQMLDKLVVDYGVEREVIAMFAGVTDQAPTINPEEVAEIKSFYIDDVTDMIDLSWGAKDSFAHVLKTGTLKAFKEKEFGV